MTLVLYPYVYVLARAAFLEQSERRWRRRARSVSPAAPAFWRVALPLARPAIVAGVTLALMEALADFGTVAIFNYSTFTVAIYRVWFGLFNRHAATELATLLVLFTLTLYGAERALRGRARFDPRGLAARPVPRTRADRLAGRGATALAATVVGAGLRAPGRSARRRGSRPAASDSRYPGFVGNTVAVAAVAAVLVVAPRSWSPTASARAAGTGVDPRPRGEHGLRPAGLGHRGGGAASPDLARPGARGALPRRLARSVWSSPTSCASWPSASRRSTRASTRITPSDGHGRALSRRPAGGGAAADPPPRSSGAGSSPAACSSSST